MKPLKEHIPKISQLLSLFFVITLAIASCSDDSTGPDENNEPTPPASSFDSGSIGAGESYSRTFDDEGSFEYFCRFHAPDMQGVVNVSSDADSSGSVTIEMQNMQYMPSEITITPGTEVTWVNNDSVPHTVTSGNPDSGGNDGGRY